MNLLEGTAWHSMKYARIFGYRKIIRDWTFDMFFDHVIPEDRPMVQAEIFRSMGLGSAFNFECRISKTDNTICWIQITGKSVLTRKGEPALVDGIVQDITERKKAELELIRAKDKAEESERLKSAFLANMSHEIRTPMNGILGFTELLKEPSLTIEEQQDFIRIIGKSGERMLNTINNIVDISKIESGVMKIDMKETSINEKIEFTYKFFKPEVENKGLKFSFRNGLPDMEAQIFTDNERVYGVLTNLVKNAIKFTKEGAIELGYEKRGDYLEFFVRDTGIGIPANKLDLIFERFRQVNESSSREFEGSGLGLSISKSYVEMLGGKIWVESKVNEGSTFYFTIPYRAVEGERKLPENIFPTMMIIH
ncbi:MAG: PAS domain-containing sensor histidine kinase [Bacteroidales bacterium]